MDLLEFMMELDIWHCLALKYMMLFTTELDILKSKKWHDIYFSYYFFSLFCKNQSYLPVEEILTLQNVVILIKSVLNKDKDH